MDYETINRIIEENKLNEALSFIITNTKLIFPKLKIPKEFMRYLINESDTNYYYTCKNEKRYWESSFLERIFEQKKRVDEVFRYAEEGDMTTLPLK